MRKGSGIVDVDEPKKDFGKSDSTNERADRG